jgi:uncharacterized membrane protein (DUF441 family)
VGPGSLARILAVVYNQAGIPIVAVALQLITFIVLTLTLFPIADSRGISAAVILVTVILSGYLTWGMRQSLPYSVAHWLKIIGLVVLCSPLPWGAWTPYPGVRWAAFTAVLLATALFFRLILAQDLTDSWNAVRAAAQGKTIGPKPAPQS